MEKVYLITTKDISVSFFEYYELVSPKDRLIADEAFWDFLTKKGCLFPVVWEKIMQSEKDSEDIEFFKKIMRDTCYDAARDSSAVTYFDVINITEDLEKTIINGKTKHDIFINALVDCFADNEIEQRLYKKLIGNVQRVKDTNIFITHNWYGSSNGALGKCSGYFDDLKYEFVELLISFLKKQFDEDIDLHLIVHDKDLLSKGRVDSILTMSDLPDIKAYVNLSDLISKEKIYVFQHTVQNEFYPEILNAKEKLPQELLVQAMNRFFQYQIPPTITNGDKSIEINILQEGTSERRCCSIREIIDAIAEFQSNGNFSLKRVLENHNGYSDAVQLMDPNKPVIVKGTKPLSELSDKRAFFLDSSIWLRYTTAVDEPYHIPAEYQRLYKTANAQETREFKARLCKNSYLQSFDGGHYRNVTPFLFHSETEMEGKTQDIIPKLKGYSHDRVIPHWRFLLVDDNAFNNETDAVTKIQKCEVISSILRKDFCVVCINEDNSVACSSQKRRCSTCAPDNAQATICIDCVRSIQDAHKKLKERRYDIVLLDYLLGGNTNSREYGTTLLTDLKKQYEDINKSSCALPDRIDEYIQSKGPFGKFWIFFISAFSNAISEEMLSKGMHYNTDYWYIARGACPTTTPELFRYNLYSLLYQQIKNITDVAVVKSGHNPSKVDRRVITLIDLLNHIFADPASTRSLALNNFNSLLHLRAHYDILKKDYYMGGKENPDAKNNGSPLVQSLFPDIEHYSNAFWEHIQHLIYLIAFGNIRQWNEMWDEYIFIKDVLRKAEGKPKNEDNVVRKIEKYIIEIKNANYR